MRDLDDRTPYHHLLIFDDILPSDFSPFRTIEYAHYLSFFDSALVSLEGWNGWLSTDTFQDAVDRLTYPDELKGRITTFADGQKLAARLAYVTFLGNASQLHEFLTLRNLPYILQLYPGGGFQLNQPASDERLRRVVLSPLCRRVIVTQPITRDYLVDIIGVAPRLVEYIYGGVFPHAKDFDFDRDKIRYPEDKSTIDICFVAHKYGADLTSKGYDSFAQIARAVYARHRHVRFHVVGNWSPDDVELGELADVTRFHGTLSSSSLDRFFRGMDAIVSINKAFASEPGAFDGFPTGACIEAGLRGVLNCINDPLSLNSHLTHMVDVMLLEGPAEESAADLGALVGDPAALYRLAKANWSRYGLLFDTDQQLLARTRIIVEELLRDDGLMVRPNVTWLRRQAPDAERAVARDNERLRARLADEREASDAESARLLDVLRQSNANERYIMELHGAIERHVRGIAALERELETLRRAVRG